MIKEFLDAILAPGKLMAALEKVREENARLRHELRRYTLHTYSMRIEPMFKRKEGYMQHLHRRALNAIAMKIADDPQPYSTVTPLSHPELASAMFPRQPSGKRCFAYCGDDICDCDAHPRFSRFPRHFGEETMQPVQIFGFTPPGPLPGETYVKFLMAFKEPDGNVKLCIRNNDGVTNDIAISTEEAMKLSLALGAAIFSHEVVVARAERRDGPA